MRRLKDPTHGGIADLPVQPRLYSGQPYWLSQSHSAPEFPALDGDINCDVAVLGGGVSGALVAFALVTEGVNTVLVDKRQVARGSTAASTGLLQYEIDVPLVELCRRIGVQRAVRAYRRGLEAIDQIENVVRQIESNCGFSRRQSLYATSSNWHLRRLRQEFACRKAFGFDVTFLGRDALLEFSSINRAGAILSHGDAQLNPYRFTCDLLAWAVEHGLRVFANTLVTKISDVDDRTCLFTPSGCVSARKLIVATGYERTAPITKRVADLQCTYAALSKPLRRFPGWPDGCLFWETGHPYFYARQVAGQRAMIGGQDTPFASDHKRDGLMERQSKKLIKQFKKLFPEIPFELDTAWAGTFAETKDGLAYIGSLPGDSTVYYALGYGGNGITFSMIAAELLRDLCLGRRNADADIFAFQR